MIQNQSIYNSLDVSHQEKHKENYQVWCLCVRFHLCEDQEDAKWNRGDRNQKSSTYGGWGLTGKLALGNLLGWQLNLDWGMGYISHCCLVTKLCLTPFWPHGLYAAGFLCPKDFPGKNTGVGHHFLLQRIFSTQGLNLCLLHCRKTLYHLSHQGSPGITL